jgi:hypothetical protein
MVDFVIAGLVLRDSILGVRLSFKPSWYRSHLLCIARNAYVLSGHVERVTRRQIMRVRVDGTSSEGSASNTLDLTPPEVDVTKATIRAWPAKMLT